MVLQKKEIHLEGHLGKEGIHRSTHIGGEKTIQYSTEGCHSGTS